MISESILMLTSLYGYIQILRLTKPHSNLWQHLLFITEHL